MTVIVANIIDFLAAIVQVGSGAIKKKSRILMIQIVQLLMQAVSMLILGGITGAFFDAATILSNSFTLYRMVQKRSDSMEKSS